MRRESGRELDHRVWRVSIAAAAAATPEADAQSVPVPGKRTLTEGLVWQRREAPDGPEAATSRPEPGPAPSRPRVSPDLCRNAPL